MSKSKEKNSRSTTGSQKQFAEQMSRWYKNFQNRNAKFSKSRKARSSSPLKKNESKTLPRIHSELSFYQEIIKQEVQNTFKELKNPIMFESQRLSESSSGGSVEFSSVSSSRSSTPSSVVNEIHDTKNEKVSDVVTHDESKDLSDIFGDDTSFVVGFEKVGKLEKESEAEKEFKSIGEYHPWPPVQKNDDLICDIPSSAEERKNNERFEKMQSLINDQPEYRPHADHTAPRTSSEYWLAKYMREQWKQSHSSNERG